jgi:hypothetical protein
MSSSSARPNWKPEVEDDHIDLRDPQLRECGVHRENTRRVVALVVQDRSERIAKVGVVLDDQRNRLHVPTRRPFPTTFAATIVPENEPAARAGRRLAPLAP